MSSFNQTFEPFWREFVLRASQPSKDDFLPEGCRGNDVCVMDFTAESVKIYGNRYLLSRVLVKKHLYEEQTQSIHNTFIRDVDGQVPPGRFMVRNEETGQWEEASMTVVHDYIHEAFRIAIDSHSNNPLDLNEVSEVVRTDTATEAGAHLTTKFFQKEQDTEANRCTTPVQSNTQTDVGVAKLQSKATQMRYAVDTVYDAVQSYAAHYNLSMVFPLDISLEKMEATKEGIKGWAEIHEHLSKGSICVQSSATLQFYHPNTVKEALQNYPSLCLRADGTLRKARLEDVEATSLGIKGWALVTSPVFPQDVRQQIVMDSIQNSKKTSILKTYNVITIRSETTKRVYMVETVENALNSFASFHGWPSAAGLALETVEQTLDGIEGWAAARHHLSQGKMGRKETIQSKATHAWYGVFTVQTAVRNYELVFPSRPGTTVTLEQVEDTKEGIRGWALMSGPKIADDDPQPAMPNKATATTNMTVAEQLDFRSTVYGQQDNHLCLVDQAFLQEFIERGLRKQRSDWLPEGCTDKDVIMGRFTIDAAKVFANRIFYNRIWYRRKMFHFAKEDRIAAIVQGIIDHVQKHGGRFVFFHGGSYYEAPLKWAQVHVRQAFGIANSTRLPGYSRPVINTPAPTARNSQEPRTFAAPARNTWTPAAAGRSGEVAHGYMEDDEAGAMLQSEISGEFYEIDFVMAALRNYEAFNGLKTGTAKLAEVEATSAGVEGWAFTVLNDDETEVSVSATTEDEDEGKKPAANIDSSDTKPAASPHRARANRRGDDEEKRALQLAMLESVGVHAARPDPKSYYYEGDDAECNEEGEEEGDTNSDDACYEYEDDDDSYEYEDEYSEDDEEGGLQSGCDDEDDKNSQEGEMEDASCEDDQQGEKEIDDNNVAEEDFPEEHGGKRDEHGSTTGGSESEERSSSVVAPVETVGEDESYSCSLIDVADDGEARDESGSTNAGEDDDCPSNPLVHVETVHEETDDSESSGSLVHVEKNDRAEFGSSIAGGRPSSWMVPIEYVGDDANCSKLKVGMEEDESKEADRRSKFEMKGGSHAIKELLREEARKKMYTNNASEAAQSHHNDGSTDRDDRSDNVEEAQDEKGRPDEVHDAEVSSDSWHDSEDEKDFEEMRDGFEKL